MADHLPFRGTMHANDVPGVEDGAETTARRVNVRVFIYVIGLHLFGAFVMLLFYTGAHRG
ncbi:DUF6126 family protein [Streptacidiphilus jiangxiensis]|uniref:Small hydrophobic protein n=1 Tax=Streptacidiphilus jiangxiensis TaxID=235985 RepID=A0A1H7Y8R1_STRJI|nr:DUF6126 family protein [Streptacidiphilus jiangxiensis]SEM42383.1 hypothetical protein SAMN05414137_12764 [Streptacidiphilus jiangxiensis]